MVSLLDEADDEVLTTTIQLDEVHQVMYGGYEL